MVGDFWLSGGWDVLEGQATPGGVIRLQSSIFELRMRLDISGSRLKERVAWCDVRGDQRGRP